MICCDIGVCEGCLFIHGVVHSTAPTNIGGGISGMPHGVRGIPVVGYWGLLCGQGITS